MRLNELLKDFADSPEFIASTSLATRNVYSGALKALLREHLAEDAGWVNESRMQGAFAHFDAVYSPTRASQARSAYRKLRDWALSQYGIAFPALKRGRPGRKTGHMPPEEVLRAADRLLNFVPHGVLSHARLLALRWEKLKVEALRGEQCVMLPGKKSGIYFSIPISSEGGEAIKVLWGFSGGQTGPVLPAEKGGERSLSLAQFRKGLTQIDDIRVLTGNGGADDGLEATVARDNLASLHALDSKG